jgi:hypothetical protein
VAAILSDEQIGTRVGCYPLDPVVNTGSRKRVVARGE